MKSQQMQERGMGLARKMRCCFLSNSWTKNLISLSEQELINCDTSDNHGCKGGLVENAFKFVKRTGGIIMETAYPYKEKNGQCDASKAKKSPIVVIDGHQKVLVNDEEALMKAVVNQPVSMAIEASSEAFQFYFEGVFIGDCGTERDHGVAVVGYGETQDGTKYWIAKNPWGSDWGERGYIIMQRGIEAQEGICGIAMDASYPIKTPPNPEKKIVQDELWLGEVNVTLRVSAELNFSWTCIFYVTTCLCRNRT